MIKIGILSDTHDLLRLEVIRHLLGCDCILHGGDISSQQILNQLEQIAPVKVNAIDSTAAGDVFLGAFAVALAEGEPVERCLNYANTAAALSTTRKGAQSSIPTPQEVMAAL